MLTMRWIRIFSSSAFVGFSHVGCFCTGGLVLPGDVEAGDVDDEDEDLVDALSLAFISANTSDVTEVFLEKTPVGMTVMEPRFWRVSTRLRRLVAFFSNSAGTF